ncbi:hypothetical protein JAAARDRAFT_189998 [Jaapia argillacea MUCL 33604]|uniref:Hydrophobin n=1 Tax=Jaapia argillacea MUCL 33604 TaxID=933084 RepID=A0A067Q958_9AGAM|nr:hypothetical protein JAAARDRAFT_189998 [Jaapia argillacea MUCL 33604]
MFKLTVFTALTILAVVTNILATGPILASECMLPIECCQTVVNASEYESILQQLGIVLGEQDLGMYLGMDCSPMTFLGPGAGSCTYEYQPELTPSPT